MDHEIIYVESGRARRRQKGEGRRSGREIGGGREGRRGEQRGKKKKKEEVNNINTTKAL